MQSDCKTDNTCKCLFNRPIRWLHLYCTLKVKPQNGGNRHKLWPVTSAVILLRRLNSTIITSNPKAKEGKSLFQPTSPVTLATIAQMVTSGTGVESAARWVLWPGVGHLRSSTSKTIQPTRWIGSFICCTTRKPNHTYPALLLNLTIGLLAHINPSNSNRKGFSDKEQFTEPYLTTNVAACVQSTFRFSVL